MPERLQADLTWTGSAFESDVVIEIADDGRIDSLSRETREPTAAPVRRLTGQALLPGFVNAHSHAFQRDLRFRPQVFGSDVGNFWSWRDTMYDLVDTLTPESCYEVSCRAFGEMLRAGMTAVGEFHYVHHGSESEWALDDAVLHAADDAGIRLVLLQTYYATGAIQKPLTGAQRRFDALSLDRFLSHWDMLGQRLKNSRQTLGVACHSIRAASIEDMVTLHARSIADGCVFHAHVEEQIREIAECREAYGSGPLALMLERLDIDQHFTAVHCTHSTTEDLAALGERGGSICICPLTEANLGDGIAGIPAMRRAGANLCIGTDCNLRLSMLEEIRLLEFAQRLGLESCGHVVDQAGRNAEGLLDCATMGGARSLGLNGGRIAPGAVADFVAVDLRNPALQGHGPADLLNALVFGCGNQQISNIWVGGVSLSM